MIPWEQDFDELQARVLFNRNMLTLEWQPGQPLQPELEVLPPEPETAKQMGFGSSAPQRRSLGGERTSHGRRHAAGAAGSGVGGGNPSGRRRRYAHTPPCKTHAVYV